MKNEIIKKPTVAIILLNWNNEADTIDCLESLKKITYSNYKIFLADNGSKEESLSKLYPYAGDKIEIVENGKNLGFSGGNNTAVKKALEQNFDYALLLNNDTTVEPDFLDELISVGESDEKIGALVPKIYYYFEPNRIWYGGGKFTWLGGGQHLQIDEIDQNPNEKASKETGYITGCAFLAKSKIIKEVGSLYDDFFMYYEDTDWSLRIKKAGYKLIYVPSSKIYHKVTRTIGPQVGKPRIHYYHIRNALLLSKRNAPKILLPGIYLWSFWKYLKQIVKLAIMPSKKEISKMIIRGIRDFYKNKFGQYQD